MWSTTLLKTKKDGFADSAGIGVTLHLSELRRTLGTPHFSRFASLDLEPFAKPLHRGLFASSSKMTLILEG
jgi:hypothetical protein